MNNIEFNFDRNMSIPVWNNEHSSSIQLDLISGVKFSAWIKPNSNRLPESMSCEIKIVQSTYRNFDKRLKVTVECGSSPYILLLNLNTKAKTFIDILGQSLSLDQNNQDIVEACDFASRDYIEIVEDQISLLTLINIMQFKPFIFIQDQSNDVTGVFTYQNSSGEILSDLQTKILITETSQYLNEFCLISTGLSFYDLKSVMTEDELFKNLLSDSAEIKSILSDDSLNVLISTLSTVYSKLNQNEFSSITRTELNSLKETNIFFRMLKEITL